MLIRDQGCRWRGRRWEICCLSKQFLPPAFCEHVRAEKLMKITRHQSKMKLSQYNNQYGVLVSSISQEIYEVTQFKINSQYESGDIPDSKTLCSHSSHCLFVHTGDTEAGSEFSTHCFPTSLESLALHTVCTVAVSTEPVLFTFWYQKSKVQFHQNKLIHF